MQHECHYRNVCANYTAAKMGWKRYHKKSEPIRTLAGSGSKASRVPGPEECNVSGSKVGWYRFHRAMVGSAILPVKTDLPQTARASGKSLPDPRARKTTDARFTASKLVGLKGRTRCVPRPRAASPVQRKGGSWRRAWKTTRAETGLEKMSPEKMSPEKMSPN